RHHGIQGEEYLPQVPERIERAVSALCAENMTPMRSSPHGRLLRCMSCAGHDRSRAAAYSSFLERPVWADTSRAASFSRIPWATSRRTCSVPSSSVTAAVSRGGLPATTSTYSPLG
ncbi:PrgI family protein, partial [Dysosmobacter welbionis]